MTFTTLKKYTVFLQGKSCALIASSLRSALLTAYELFSGERIYRVVETPEWDHDYEE